MNWLSDHGFGAPTEAGPLPTVPAAVTFDLIFAKGASRPDSAMDYAASQAAIAGPVKEGSVGADVGATVSKIYGRPMKGGVGTAAWQIPGGPMVAALAVVNAVGDIWDHDRQEHGFPRCLPLRRGEPGRTDSGRSPQCCVHQVYRICSMQVNSKLEHAR
jgi:L-aminopeptidase/D-esterase